MRGVLGKCKHVFELSHKFFITKSMILVLRSKFLFVNYMVILIDYYYHRLSPIHEWYPSETRYGLG